MGGLEAIFIWTAVSLYALAFVMFLGGMVFKKPRMPGYAYWVSFTAFLVHTAAILARWQEVGHLPVMHTYENAVGGTWFVSAIYLAMRYIFPPSRPFGVAVIPVVLLVLGNGIQVGGTLQPLEAPYRSGWLYIHVFFGQISFGAYVLAFAAAIMYLLKGRGQGGLSQRLPDLKLLDELTFRLILFGFFAEAVMIASGAIWAHGLWGRYWAWDPVETWSLISWLTYGLYLHLRVTMGWRGKRAAWLAIVSLLGIVVLFFGLGFVSNLHTTIF